MKQQKENDSTGACAGVFFLVLLRKDDVGMRIKRIAALTALFLLTAAFVCSLNVFAAPVEETDAPTPTAPVATQGTQPTEPTAPTLPSGAFTPDGQGSVLDYVENETDEKLFYTISTKSGNVFYLVVDEARGEQNVYFLNAVTESDLTALAEENNKTSVSGISASQTCTCTDKCESGKVNEDCPVCKKDITKCEGKSASTADEPAGGKSEKDSGNITIIINSVNLDCTRKFRNFWNSSFAIRRINDKLCLEHGLSIVENPKPSKGHYGTWLGDDQKVSYQEQLRRIIDTVLEEKPTDFTDFLEKLKSYGVTVNTDRKNLRLKVPGQTKFTRCNTLKGDYTEQAIRERIDGKRTVTPKRGERKPQPKVGLLIDIDAAIRSGKGAGYERWAKVFNLKQLSQAVLYLKEHGDLSYEELKERTAAAVTRFNELSAEIKDLESQMTANAELQKQIVNYAKTRSVYAEYRKAGYSKKFREAYEADILIHQAAKKYFDSLGANQPLSVKALRGKYSKLLARKRKAYAAYKQAREEMKELYNVKSNVEHLLNIDEREIERDREKEQR